MSIYNKIKNMVISGEVSDIFVIKELENGYYTGYFKLSNGQENVLANIIEAE